MHVGATLRSPARTSTPPGRCGRSRRSGCTFAYPTFPAITQDADPPSRLRTRRTSARSASSTTRAARDAARVVQAKFPPAPVVTLFGMTETCGGVSWSAPGRPVREADDDRRPAAPRRRGPDRRPRDGRGAAGRRARRDHRPRRPGCSSATTTTPRRRPRRCAAAGSTPATSAGSTTDGRLTFLGRLKDMLKVGGENVAAIEIEAYLATHPAVKIAQVVGVPDARYQEVPGRVRRARRRLATRPRRS